MLVIRREQIDALSAYMMRQFEDRMMVSLEVDRVLVQQGVRKAAGYRIDDEPDVERFLVLMTKFGADFDVSAQFEWARPILTHAVLPGHAKIDLIHEGLPR